MISIGNNDELKITIKSSDASGNKNKTIRYLNPLANLATETNITEFARNLMASSKDPYVATTGTVELGIFEE